MYAVSVMQHLIVMLGGMEMAYEFLKMHPIIEPAAVEFTKRGVANGFSAHQTAELFFDHHCQPLIETDREALAHTPIDFRYER